MTNSQEGRATLRELVQQKIATHFVDKIFTHQELRVSLNMSSAESSAVIAGILTQLKRNNRIQQLSDHRGRKYQVTPKGTQYFAIWSGDIHATNASVAPPVQQSIPIAMPNMKTMDLELTLTYPLRPGFTSKITIPMDATAHEINRMKAYLSTFSPPSGSAENLGSIS